MIWIAVEILSFALIEFIKNHYIQVGLAVIGIISFFFLIFSMIIGQSLNTVNYSTYTVKQLDKIKTNTTEISNVDSIQVEYCEESRVEISYLKGIVKKTLLTDKNCVNIKKSPNDKKSIIKYTVKKKPQISDYLFWLPRIKKATVYVIYD